jgi:predicted DNA-binding transcriptional regulator YafY
MANTSSRTLRLLSLLQTRRHWPGAELAGRLGVSVRTLRRDVDRLRELGYPVEAERGADGGYQLAAGATLPPLVLDDEEAVALGVGLQAAVQGDSVAGIAEASVRALTKVVQVMPGRLRRQVDALAAMTVPASWGRSDAAVDPAVLVSVAQAARDGERLEFTYTARDGGRSVRHVEPHRLVLLGRRWYLVAWDLTRFDWRSFRIDRLAELRSTGAHFSPRPFPAGDAATFVRAGIEHLPALHAVEALVDAPAAVVAARLGRWATVEAIDAGRCRLRMSSDSLDWPAMALGATGADFEVVSPPELSDYLRDLAERFGRATSTGRTAENAAAGREKEGAS